MGSALRLNNRRDPFVFDVDEHRFQEKVLDASDESLVMVDFWADWCSPCRALTPVLETIAHEFKGRFLLAKVEVDDNMRLAGHYKLRGFPTVILFRRKKPIDRFAGYKPAHTIRELVEAHLSELVRMADQGDPTAQGSVSTRDGLASSRPVA